MDVCHKYTNAGGGGGITTPREEHDYSDHRNLIGQSHWLLCGAGKAGGSVFLLLPEVETAQKGVNLAKAISGQSKE